MTEKLDDAIIRDSPANSSNKSHKDLQLYTKEQKKKQRKNFKLPTNFSVADRTL